MLASYWSSKYTYDVFLSFGGENTPRNFTDHLYEALIRSGIRTFRDDNGIPRGEMLWSEIEKGIRGSNISVIVLSKDYATSSWCLDELALILELKRTEGHKVVPVFYNVDPSHPRNPTESYGEAFVKHERRVEMKRVEGWKAALKELADMKGMELKDRYESQFIQNIVDEVRRQRRRNRIVLYMKRGVLLLIVLILFFFVFPVGAFAIIASILNPEGEGTPAMKMSS